MGTDAVARHLFDRLGGEGRIVHELEVVKIGKETIVLGSELR